MRYEVRVHMQGIGSSHETSEVQCLSRYQESLCKQLFRQSKVVVLEASTASQKYSLQTAAGKAKRRGWENENKITIRKDEMQSIRTFSGLMQSHSISR